MTVSALAVQLGTSTASLRTWSHGVDSMQTEGRERFLPVVVQGPGGSKGSVAEVVLHTPGGYSVSGLGLDELVARLRGLE